MREALSGLTVRGRAFVAAGVTAIVCAVVLGQPSLSRVGVLVLALPLVSAFFIGRSRYRLASILKGECGWPHQPGDRDVLYFLSQSFRAHLVKDLPAEKSGVANGHRELAHRAKALLKDLASISLEMAQMVVSKQGEGDALPDWFVVEIVRDLPRLVEKRDGA